MILKWKTIKRKRFQDYKEQIRIGDRYGFGRVSDNDFVFFGAKGNSKFVDSDYLKKHPEATCKNQFGISIRYARSVSCKRVSISPTNKQGSILLWYDVSLYSSDVEMLFQIARDYYQQEKDKNCWYEERWYEEDLEAALQYHDIQLPNS